jgi:hypothetical protein
MCYQGLMNRWPAVVVDSRVALLLAFQFGSLGYSYQQPLLVNAQFSSNLCRDGSQITVLPDTYRKALDSTPLWPGDFEDYDSLIRLYVLFHDNCQPPGASIESALLLTIFLALSGQLHNRMENSFLVSILPSIIGVGDYD